MLVALIGLACWLLVIGVGIALAAAAKRGDAIAENARRYLQGRHFETTSTPRCRGQPCRAPIQCSRSCTISSSSR